MVGKYILYNRDMRVLTIMVIPRAKIERVIQETPTSFKVYVTQPAEKGKANKAMLRVLARYLQVRNSDLILSKGERYNEKTVVLLDDAVRLDLPEDRERIQ